MGSERSWQRTNRLAGWLFAGQGLILLVIAFVVPPPALFPTLIVGTVAAGVVPPAHSWWNRNTDPGGSPADAGR
ncbi:putative membrane protein [Streptosporangium lutulentum]|uniref:Membrane protein n=2 Tax=Streptosporangium lutulentum TaxID=1461250 RepID=A0ABT9QSF9_9ACTN|nr:putative membrane protein [Streptosporangium lutulentum]